MLNRQKFIRIFKASPTPTSIVLADDPKFTFLHVNEAYTEMTQTKEDDLIGRSLFESFPENPEEIKPTGVERLRNSFRKVIADKSEHELDQIRYDIKLNDNEYKEIYWKVINTPVLGDDGKVEFIINSAQNITDQVLSERSNKLMLNNTEDSFILIDKNLTVQNFNDLFAEYYQEIFDIEVKKGVSILEYAQPERRDILKGIYERVFKGETIVGELPAVTPEGNTRYFTIKYKPAENKHGEIIGSFVSLLEKTDEHLAKLELKKNEEKFRNVVEHSTNMFYQHDVNGVLNYVSPQSKEFLGYSPEHAKQNWQDFITNHPINREGEKLTQKALETGKVQEPYELQLITKDNRIIWVEVNEAPLLKDDQVVGIVGSLTDITDRKKYEKQLKQSLERYDYVSRVSRDAIYDWDITNNIIHWGEGYSTLFGHKAGEDKYPIRNWEKLVHSDDLKETMRDLNFTLEDSSMNKWTSEYRLKKAKGGYACVMENGYIIRNEDGKAIRMIGALRDVTESKQTEIQNEIRRAIAEIFKEQRNLNEILVQVLSYLANYGRFETAEIWLKSLNETHQNLIANFSRQKKGESFYKCSLDKRQFKKGEGFQGTVWNSKEIEVWDNIDTNPSLVRSTAAKEVGIKSAFGIPLFHNEEFTGVLLFSSAAKASANNELLELFEGLQNFLGAEIKRKQQEEEFQLLFESAPEILAFAAPNGQFARVNPAFCDLLGYTEEELTSQSFDKFIHPDDREATLKEYYETRTSDRLTSNFINRYVTKSGETVYISWNYSDIFGEDGLYFAYGRNVTETVKLEQLLQLTNRLAKVGSWELDLTEDNKKQKVYWSDMTREIFEVQDDYEPNLSDDLEFFQPESREILKDAVQKAKDKGKSYDHEIQVVTAKGTPKWVRCIGSAEFVKGRCKRIYGSIQDINDKKIAEIELEKAFKEKNTILESIGDAFFAVDNDWTVTYWNKEAEQVLMKPREEIIGKNLWVEYEDAKDLEFYSQYHKAVEEQISVNFEEYYPGAEKWFEVSAYPSQNGLSVFFRDVTDRKQAEQQIRESNRKLKTAQKIAKLGYWKRDLNTNQMYWSDEVYSIWELDPEKAEPTLSYLYESIHPDDLEEFKNEQQQALEDYKEHDIEHRIVLDNGSVKWVHEKGSLNKENGKPVSFEGTVQDITAKKTAKLEIEEALREKETILESIEDGFFTLNKNWVVTYWNRAAERMLYTPKQDIVGQNLWDVFDEAIDLPSYTNYHRAMHQKVNVDFEEYWPAMEKWFDISAYPSPDGISVFFKDITERKKASEKLEQLNAELKQRADELAASNAELEQFAYVASHDLQEPLRMVSSFLTQLDKKYSDKLDEKANEYIHYAVDGAQRMRQIILDLLNYSRLNKDQTKREKVDLNKLLEDAKSMERSHILETEAEITSDKLPVLNVNPGAIKQVFQNLLNNSIKYHRSGVAPKIKISVKEQDTHWKFSFKDNGIGINEEFKETIFQIFQRLHTHDHYSGTGIGLAISKKIIERHEGEIWVKSKEGKGSTFHFTLKK